MLHLSPIDLFCVCLEFTYGKEGFLVPSQEPTKGLIRTTTTVLTPTRDKIPPPVEENLEPSRTQEYSGIIRTTSANMKEIEPNYSSTQHSTVKTTVQKTTAAMAKITHSTAGSSPHKSSAEPYIHKEAMGLSSTVVATVHNISTSFGAVFSTTIHNPGKTILLIEVMFHLIKICLSHKLKCVAGLYNVTNCHCSNCKVATVIIT